jgi:hypothetical protein
MTRYDKPIEPEIKLTPQPPNTLTGAENSVVEWLRRIHTQGKAGFQKEYPGLVAQYPNGDKFGYLMASTCDGMEKAIQETVFNQYEDLRRLFVVLVAQNDRESTAALRSMPTRKLPTRVSVVVGRIEGRLFIPSDEFPPQNEWRNV